MSDAFTYRADERPRPSLDVYVTYPEGGDTPVETHVSVDDPSPPLAREAIQAALAHLLPQRTATGVETQEDDR